MAIERKFVSQNLKEFRIKEFVASSLSRVGLSDIKLQRTPLGDKIIVRASRPGLIVGRGGSNIQRLTEELKEKFQLENPQIEIEEVENFGLDANIVAEMIVNSLERFGSNRFKGVGHRAMEDVMNAGALGVEIIISGKVPSSRAKSWRYYQGYLKKCGDVAVTGLNISYKTAVLKTGAVGVKVSILPPTTKLPDTVVLHEPTIEEVVEPGVVAEMESVVIKEERPAEPKKAPKNVRKKAPKKAAASTEKQKDEEKRPIKNLAKKAASKKSERKDDAAGEAPAELAE